MAERFVDVGHRSIGLHIIRPEVRASNHHDVVFVHDDIQQCQNTMQYNLCTICVCVGTVIQEVVFLYTAVELYRIAHKHCTGHLSHDYNGYILAAPTFFCYAHISTCMFFILFLCIRLFSLYLNLFSRYFFCAKRRSSIKSHTSAEEN